MVDRIVVMKIGIAGTGKMGAALAARLKDVGHEIMVWNRTPDKARSLGHPAADTPATLAKSCEALITILTDGKAVDEVYAQLLAADVKGKLFIEMSTVRPSTQKETGSKAKAKGAAYVECPVGGTTGPARQGQLFGFAGGERANVERAMPLLKQMCRRVEHVGGAGAGARMKLAINLPLLVYWQALGEALSLARSLGIEETRLMDILADTSGAASMMKNRAPIIAAALAGKEPAVTSNIDTMRKDLAEMVAEARELGWQAPMTERALECFDHASQQGLGAKDCVMLPVSWSARPQKL
ncbi:MAG: NAD(P)-dependent oxidoreductase [Betaproteobacteria bacterium]